MFPIAPRKVVAFVSFLPPNILIFSPGGPHGLGVARAPQGRR